MNTHQLYPPHTYRPDTGGSYPYHEGTAAKALRKRIQNVRRKRKHANWLRRHR